MNSYSETLCEKDTTMVKQALIGVLALGMIGSINAMDSAVIPKSNQALDEVEKVATSNLLAMFKNFEVPPTDILLFTLINGYNGTIMQLSIDLIKFLEAHSNEYSKDEGFSWLVDNCHAFADNVIGKICKQALDKGADVNVVDKDGNTPLFYAAQYGLPGICVLLI